MTMDLKAYLLDEDRGVSPVIGVILMVAITVILAAVIATFVMNMGPPKDQAPTTSWDATVDGTELTISHTGGSAIPVDTLSVRVDGDSAVNTYDFTAGSSVSSGNDVTASDSVVISVSSSSGSPSPSIDATSEISANDLDNANSVEIVWNAPNSDTSEILYTWKP